MAETVLFERYRLVEPAGRGGSAEVWRALDETTGDEVAVKRLHPVVFADEAGRRRLRREFDTLRTLDEPHIVRVRDLRFGEREAALVLDFVPGESLARRLARQAADGAAMDPAVALAIVEDVAAALSAAHAAGIVHRDVTPANILLTPDGEARLTDFGIAHASTETATVTATGLLMGTLRYLAPELLRGGGSTPASDLYGLAAVAYEMLAGHPAYEATSPVALAEAQQIGPPPIGGVTSDVDAAVRSGLAVDPAARPVDVAAFAAGLAASIENEATIATPIAADEPTAVIALPDSGTVGVASPSRAAAVHGPLPLAVGLRDRASADAPQRAAGRRVRGVPAPIAVGLGLVLAFAALAAAATLDRAGPAGGAVRPNPAVANDPSPTARPSPKPTATPDAERGKGDGDGKDHGKGHGD
jgi:serine/threonine-protein kinase